MVVALVLLDQITKFFAYQSKPYFRLLGDFLEIQYVENTGTIWGLFKDSNIVFIFLAVLLCVIMVWYKKKYIEKGSISEKCFQLIIAGGIGNLIDRIFRGFVVDFISLKWVGVFNVADSLIVIGVAILLWIEVKGIEKNGKRSRKSNV